MVEVGLSGSFGGAARLQSGRRRKCRLLGLDLDSRSGFSIFQISGAPSTAAARDSVGHLLRTPLIYPRVRRCHERRSGAKSRRQGFRSLVLGFGAS